MLVHAFSPLRIGPVVAPSYRQQRNSDARQEDALLFNTRWLSAHHVRWQPGISSNRKVDNCTALFIAYILYALLIVEIRCMLFLVGRMLMPTFLNFRVPGSCASVEVVENLHMLYLVELWLMLVRAGAYRHPIALSSCLSGYREHQYLLD